MERINGVIADVLRSFANERGDDWPALVPLVEFAINDSASPLGSGYYSSSARSPAARPRPTPSGEPALPQPQQQPLQLRLAGLGRLGQGGEAPLRRARREAPIFTPRAEARGARSKSEA